MAWLDPIFNPLLALQPIYVILIMSIAITAIMTLLYKLFTDQKLMKTLKEEMKVLQKQVKEYSQHPEKLATVQKEIMQKNMQYMKHSMRPTLITMLPIILIIGWMAAHLSFMPLAPNVPFNITVTAEGIDELLIEANNLTLLSNEAQKLADGKATWQLKGSKGEYYVSFSSGDVFAEKKILVTDEFKYEVPTENIKNSAIKQIEVGNKRLYPMGDFSLFGWRPQWLGIYIVVSIITSMGLRKFLKIH
jgi:uncharacterized membrane protein (DUF106 family)